MNADKTHVTLSGGAYAAQIANGKPIGTNAYMSPQAPPPLPSSIPQPPAALTPLQPRIRLNGQILSGPLAI
jgi:hypothetical protein